MIEQMLSKYHNLLYQHHNVMSLNFYSGRSPSQEKLDKLIKDHDKDGNGTIGWFT